MLPALLGLTAAAAASAAGCYQSMAPNGQWFGRTFARGMPGSRQIALTYDDGPNDPHTLKLLDVLAKHSVYATFFMIGRYVEQRPEIARAVAAAGHVIGNHTFSHPLLIFESAARTRQELLEVTRLKLEAIAAPRKTPGQKQPDPKPPRKQTKKKGPSAEKIGARVGRVLQRYKMGKFIDWSVQEGKLEWQFDQEKVAAEERFDGCYVVASDVPPEQMAKAQVVASYKRLSFVEQAFRNLKTVQLELRPVYHKKDQRIRAHVFICLLAYYLQWHARQRLQPLFDKDGQGKERQWTFRNVIEHLATIRRNRVKNAGVEFDLNTSADPEQQTILDLLAGKKT